LPAEPPRLHATAELLAELAPPELAADWDNSGWQIRLEDEVLRGVLVSLDATPEVVEEARLAGANLLVTHHPLFFRSPRSLDRASPVGATAIAAVRAGLSVLALHTSLDAAPGGTSWALAAALGLTDGALLEPHQVPGSGYGVVARAESRRLADWAAQAEGALGTPPLALSGDPDARHETVAVMGGSGAFLAERARAAGASLFLTADIRYHEAQQAMAMGLSLIALDHYASERPVMDRVASFLRERTACPVTCSVRRTTPWETFRP
jgi:dinuclear metal center YbgI/SA1388 family protein